MRPHSCALFVPVLFVVLPLLVPDEASGQQIRSPYAFIDTRHETGILVGAATENRGELGLGPGGGPLIQGRYGLKLGSAFAFEAIGFFIHTDRRVIDPEAEDGPQLLGTTASFVGGLDGRLRFSPTGARTWNDLAPYLVAGGGLALDLRRSSALEEEMSPDARFSFGPSFLGTLGAGTRWLPGDRLGFRVEAAFHLWKIGTPRPFLQLGEEFGPVPDQEWTGLGSILLGASLRF